MTTLTHEEVTAIATDVEALLDNRDEATALVAEKLTDFLVENFVEQVEMARDRKKEMEAWQAFLAATNAQDELKATEDAVSDVTDEAVQLDTKD